MMRSSGRKKSRRENRRDNNTKNGFFFNRKNPFLNYGNLSVFLFGVGSGNIRAVFPCVEFFHDSVIGSLRNIRKRLAPAFGSLFKTFFKCCDHLVRFFRIAAAERFCKIYDTVGGLLYAPIAVIRNIFLRLCFDIGGNRKVAAC